MNYLRAVYRPLSNRFITALYFILSIFKWQLFVTVKRNIFVYSINVTDYLSILEELSPLNIYYFNNKPVNIARIFNNSDNINYIFIKPIKKLYFFYILPTIRRNKIKIFNRHSTYVN